MRQVFRLMDVPDKMIAFDELPEYLLEGIELHDCGKMTKDWREFIGLREKLIKLKPERNLITQQMETFPPIVQKGYYAYLIDREINPDKDRWREIESYVKRNAPKDFRLTDPIVDIETGKSTMAKALANDSQSEIMLEPEEVIVIPLPKIEETVEAQHEAGIATVELAPKEEFKCDKCDKSYPSKPAIRMHKMKAHPEKKSE
jgi:hypothetical protein